MLRQMAIGREIYLCIFSEGLEQAKGVIGHLGSFRSFGRSFGEFGLGRNRGQDFTLCPTLSP
ncbi:MAG TPA: hypothetical protein DCF33_07525 [Saprospirales bacterium]|nr:hypothetical protein [Saprospirales bacterium]